jgi:hypothetical protein
MQIAICVEDEIQEIYRLGDQVGLKKRRAGGHFGFLNIQP